MIYPKIKRTYKNDIAYIYIADKINLFNNYYQLVFIGRVEDGCIYDGEKCEYTPSNNYGICIVLKLSCGDIFVMEREGWTE